MKGWISLLFLVACSDAEHDGARDNCAEGGTLNQCPAAERTPEGACWRLVDCGALPLESSMNFNWAGCVDAISGMRELAQELVISCIASATCDQLKYDRDFCFDYGDF